jgi:signal transduction histidine kinase
MTKTVPESAQYLRKRAEEKHRLTIDSEFGKGTSVIVSLPVQGVASSVIKIP